MPKKQVFLLYNNESEKDLLIANNLASFLSIDPSISLRDIMAGQDAEDVKKHLLESDIVVPVVSIDFLNLKSAVDLVEEANASDVNIQPILFRQCPWEQIPILKKLAPNIVPKEKPLNEYDEKSSDGVLTSIFNSIKLALFGDQETGKVSIDKFYLGLFIAAILFAVATSVKAYNSFYLDSSEIGTTLTDKIPFVNSKAIFYLYVLGNVITIGLPLMKLLASRILTAIFTKK